MGGAFYYKTPAVAAASGFSDSFNQVASPRGRGGDLDSRVWSTGRLAPHDTVQPSNPNWIRAATIPSGIQTGFGSTSVYPPNDMLVSNTGTHNGQLMTCATIQNYGNASFMIRQPFDFTGRTGTIVVYVDAKSPSSIGYYLQIAITADPIPCPTYLAGGNEETGPIPRHGVVLPFKDGQSGQPASSRINIATAYVYNAYAQTVLTASTNLTGTNAPATLDGSLNRIELRVSTSLMSVYMSDYSPDGVSFPNQRLVWEASMSLPFSVGYVHFGLRNHASLKFGMPTTGVYYWGSAAFDGPALPVPRAYEIPDNTTTDTITDDVSEGAILVQHLGYRVGDGSSIAEGVWSPTALISPLTFTGSVNISGATTAKLALNVFFLPGGSPALTTSSGLKYKFNGGTWRTRTLTSDEVTAVNTSGAAGLMGLLIDLNLADLQSGTNTIDFSSVSVPSGGYYPMICNIDLLVYA